MPDNKPSWLGRWFKRDTRADAAGGFQNVYTGIGTPEDKRSGTRFSLSVVPSAQAMEMWRGNDLAKRIIEERAEDALREGFAIKTDDKEIAEKVMDALEALPGPMHIGKGWKRNLLRVRQIENAVGGGALWPVINDGAGSMSEELNEGAIGKIERLQVFESRELRPSRKYADPLHPKYGEPSHYYVVPIGDTTVASPDGTSAFAEIHETRLIIFPGVRVSREELSGVEQGWGDNVITPIRAVLNDFEMIYGGAANLLSDFAQAVLKIENLAELLALQDGTAQTRLSETNRWRSSLRALVLDKNDSFERVTTPLTGLPEMMDRFMYRVAAAARYPVSKLFGMAAAGMNATGEADQDNWYDVLSAEQEYLTPPLVRLIELLMLSREGPTNGKIPEAWSVEWAPLTQPSEKETAETRKLTMETDTGYIAAQVVSPEEVAFARFGGDTYSAELVIDFDARERLELATSKPVVTTGKDPDVEPPPPPVMPPPGTAPDPEAGEVDVELEDPEAE